MGAAMDAYNDDLARLAVHGDALVYLARGDVKSTDGGWR